jgi:threonyl-tRNA synthetase
LWLCPTQVVVATITQEADGYAQEVAALLSRHGLRVETDIRNEKINYKVREHMVAKRPVLLVVGKREAAERAVAMRRLGSESQAVLTLDQAIADLVAESLPPA